MSATRYTLPAIALHWLLALMILGAFGFGLYMTDLPFSPARLKLYNWHKWAGVTILALTVLRLLWRLSHRPPAPPAMPAWQQQAYKATHGLMYALFFAVPLAGWVYSSASGFPVVVFGVLPLPDLVAPDKAMAEDLKSVHAGLALALGAAIALHLAAVVQHQFIHKDGLLSRMLPRMAGKNQA
jgi:cytochrome b561